MAKAKELKELLLFMCAFGNALGKASDDGKISRGEVLEMLPLLSKVPSAFGGMTEIPAEVKELSEEDIAELAQFVKDELELPQDKVEEAIEGSIDICLKLYALAQKLRA